MRHIPAQAGFHMPAEWEEHEGTWLQWPHDDTHTGNQVRLEHIWLMMTEALHEHEIVHIVVPDERRLEHVNRQIAYYGLSQSSIDLHVFPTNDVWARDSGPIFLVNDNGDLAATDWNFNGWGKRYAFDKDRKVPAGIAEMLSVPLFTAPITLEGGGIEVNGKGTLLATRSSIVNPNRNPGVTQEEIEEALRQYLCIERIIWLSGAVGVGDTDMHIDGAARFVDEATVLYSWTDDASHPRHAYLKQHLNELEKAVSDSGESLTLVSLPLTEARVYSTRDTATAPPFVPVPSLGIYANYYVANNVVLVPVYGDVNDSRAKGIISEHFPGRMIIGIPARPLAQLGGMIHCVTQQQPMAKRRTRTEKTKSETPHSRL
jgi:agmatine deiminase